MLAMISVVTKKLGTCLCSDNMSLSFPSKAMVLLLVSLKMKRRNWIFDIHRFLKLTLVIAATKTISCHFHLYVTY